MKRNVKNGKMKEKESESKLKTSEQIQSRLELKWLKEQRDMKQKQERATRSTGIFLGKNLKLILAIVVGVNLIVSENAYTQNISSSRKNETPYCMPMWQAERLFEDAIEKLYLDSALENREIRVESLEQENEDMVVEYEKLLANCEANKISSQNIASLNHREIKSLEQELKQQKKKTVWANIKFYSALTLAAVMTWLAIEN